MIGEIQAWATKHGITPQAWAELWAILRSPADVVPVAAGMSEAACQQRIRLEAPRRGALLWRNNVGVLKDERGVPVRYGLANDSPRVNKRVKSSDLIGINPVEITPAHVGTTIGQFWCVETKKPGWTFSGTDHELAQLKFIDIVQSYGGLGTFATSEGDL